MDQDRDPVPGGVIRGRTPTIRAYRAGMRRATLPLALLILALPGCSSDPTPAATTPPTPAKPTVQLDSYARLACERLDRAVQIRSAGPTPGSPAADPQAEVEFRASLEEFRAATDAMGSKVPAVVEIVQRHDTAKEGGDALTAELRTWCDANWTPGR